MGRRRDGGRQADRRQGGRERIITQGQNPSGGFIKLYRMEYTEDGKTWKPVNLVSTPGVEKVGVEDRVQE